MAGMESTSSLTEKMSILMRKMSSPTRKRRPWQCWEKGEGRVYGHITAKYNAAVIVAALNPAVDSSDDRGIAVGA